MAVPPSPLLLLTAAGLALAADTASAAIVARLAATALRRRPAFPLAVAAAVLQLLAMASLVAAARLFLARRARTPVLAACLAGTTLALLATVLALVALLAALHLPGHLPDRHSDMAGAGIAMALAALVPLALFYALVWPRPHTAHPQPTPPTSVRPQSIAVRLGSLASPSRRHSASNGLKPMSSRTRLLLSTSWGSACDTRELRVIAEAAPETVRSTDEFEKWDTSKMDADFDTAFPSKSRLETIPGSRPVSPDHPLHTPFARDADHTPGPPSPADTPVASPPSSEAGSLRNFPRSMMIPASSSAPDTADESHIHPLFRTESPAPPPTASPGTIITASPYGGQVVSPDLALTHPKILGACSRPASPSLRTPSRSRAASTKSSRGGAPPSPKGHEPMPVPR